MPKQEYLNSAKSAKEASLVLQYHMPRIAEELLKKAQAQFEQADEFIISNDTTTLTSFEMEELLKLKSAAYDEILGASEWLRKYVAEEVTFHDDSDEEVIYHDHGKVTFHYDIEHSIFALAEKTQSYSGPIPTLKLLHPAPNNSLPLQASASSNSSSSSSTTVASASSIPNAANSHTNSEPNLCEQYFASLPKSSPIVLEGPEKERLLDMFKDHPRYWRELTWMFEDGIFISELPKGNETYKKIENILDEGIRNYPYTSQAQEATRMIRPTNILADPNATELQIEKAKKRLKEGKAGGAARISSGEIKVDKIIIIANLSLWEKYIAARRIISEELEATEDITPLENVKWSNTANSPVIEQRTGEVYLIKVSAFNNIIIQSGFRPDLSPNKGKGEEVRYGPLGQGEYFADTLSKAMTYAICPNCLDYPLGCGSPSEALVTRVVLGHPKKMRGHIQKFFQGGSLRSQNVNEIKERRHSVYSRGWDTKIDFGLASSGSGSNEFVVKNPSQMYPEFRIYWRHA